MSIFVAVELRACTSLKASVFASQNKDVVQLVIGYHMLEGKKVAFRKPMALLQKEQDADSPESCKYKVSCRQRTSVLRLVSLAWSRCSPCKGTILLCFSSPWCRCLWPLFPDVLLLYVYF